MLKTQQVFKAIADPTRRRVLKLLSRGSKTAGELSESFDMTKGSLSHHFNILKAADLVRSERRGQTIVYSLNTTVFEDVASLLFDLFQMDPAREKNDDDQTRGARGPRVRRPVIRRGGVSV